MALTRTEVDEVARAVASKVIHIISDPDSPSSPEAVSEILEKHTVNPSKLSDPWALTGAAIPEGPCLKGWHVTDRPENILGILEKGKDITEVGSGVYEDLRSNGIYFSAAPQLWTGRAPAKFEFLKHLSPEERRTLGDAVLKAAQARGPGYLTSWELERLERDVNYFVRGEDPVFLLEAADQPYNIRFWSPEFLTPLGISNPSQPKVVPITACGKFVKLTDIPKNRWDDVIMLAKEEGYVGAVQKGGLVTVPQSVVWESGAVKEFDDYHRKEG